MLTFRCGIPKWQASIFMVQGLLAAVCRRMHKRNLTTHTSPGVTGQGRPQCTCTCSNIGHGSRGKRSASAVRLQSECATRITRSAPADLQLVLPWLLQQTIADKRGLEHILTHASSALAPDSDTPSTDVLPSNALDYLSGGFLKETLIVRPAQLKDTDGSNKLRAGEEISTYSTGRVELGKWIAAALRNRAAWMNRRVTVGF